ncbi:putative holin-like toxin [Vagococcus salmoninarum]|nr:putative holin-like toxin [Vagococcus salmoninarum]RST92416.1 putative holin-like toxin [Vagococcus salmoninarum]
MSAYETIKVILGFGMFTIALITLMVKLLKNDEKK